MANPSRPRHGWWRPVLAAAAVMMLPARAADEQILVILHTNDLHGHVRPWAGWEGDLAGQRVGGLARLAHEVGRARAGEHGERTLLLDAGDTLGDTMEAAATKGRVVIEAMNAMRYDAMAIGNHETDFTTGVLRQRMAEATFPLLAANIHGKGGKPFARPYVIRDVRGLRVGILGLAYPNTPLTTARRNVEDVTFLPAVMVARQFVPRMRREGAQVVIALTHLGLGADRALAEKVAGIDVIVGGHGHNRMREAMRVRDTLIVQAGAHGSDLGRLDLVVREGRVVEHRRTLIPLTGESEDATVQAILDRHLRPLHQQLSRPVARAGTQIVRAQTLAGQEPGKRDAESAADDLLADALRESTRADIAFLPGVGYGVALQAGAITEAALRNLVPHDAPAWTMRLDGSAIRAVLEQAIENFSADDPARKVGGMIQVSGLAFTYDPTAPRGRRVVDVRVGGEALRPRDRYRVAVNGLLAEGGHNYRQFREAAERRQVGKQFDLTRDWLASRATVSAPPLERIRKVSAGGAS